MKGLKENDVTDAQYGSSAGITLSSESLKIPFLNTSFESEAPMLNYVWHLVPHGEELRFWS